MASLLSMLFGSKNNVANLDSESFEKMAAETEDSVLLDVRTQEEYDQIRIPDSILIDIYQPDFINRINKLDRDKTYFIYCRSGNRSYHAAVHMKKMGFEKVFNLEYGISDYTGKVEP